MLKQESNLQRIKEIRAILEQVSNPSEEFTESVEQLALNHGIDPHVVTCSETHFNTILRIGNIEKFVL